MRRRLWGEHLGQGFSRATGCVYALLLLACIASGCENHVRRTAVQITGGDPDRAAAAVRKYGCGSCHTIPGIDGANAVVGPPLNSFSRRSYIAGHLSNNPDLLIRWIRHPHSFKQETAMPEMGVGEQDARDIAAYLYTLQ
jgi:cytochrome c